MKLNIKHQNDFSRGELILRTLFGLFYIDLPHLFLLMFVGIWSSILTFIAFWSILFTGRYPESFFEFQVKYYRWQLRHLARFWNLADGYPAFGINGTDEYTDFQLDYPERLSRGKVLIKALFGIFYVALPHQFVLFFVGVWGSMLRFVAWWVVLFTGSYPESWHNYNVGLLRWMFRVNVYFPGYMSDDYPPFSGREDDSSGNPSAQVEPENVPLNRPSVPLKEMPTEDNSNQDLTSGDSGQIDPGKDASGEEQKPA